MIGVKIAWKSLRSGLGLYMVRDFGAILCCLEIAQQSELIVSDPFELRRDRLALMQIPGSPRNWQKLLPDCVFSMMLTQSC